MVVYPLNHGVYHLNYGVYHLNYGVYDLNHKTLLLWYILTMKYFTSWISGKLKNTVCSYNLKHSERLVLTNNNSALKKREIYLVCFRICLIKYKGSYKNTFVLKWSFEIILNFKVYVKSGLNFSKSLKWIFSGFPWTRILNFYILNSGWPPF